VEGCQKSLSHPSWPPIVIDDLANICHRYVTLWPWPLSTWPWTLVVYRVSCDQTPYQIWAKSNNPKLSYRWFSKFLFL